MRILLVALLLSLSVTFAAAQTPNVRFEPTTVTLAQIAQFQEREFAKLRVCMGLAVWIDESPGASAETTGTRTPRRTVEFANDGPKSVVLVQPWSGRGYPARRDGLLDWSAVMAATFVDGEIVYAIRKPANREAPIVERAPYNPAVHEKNPLVAFHPRMLADERVGLRELTALAPNMPNQPVVEQFPFGKELRIRITFANSNTPGEALVYVVNPHRGYLTEQVLRLSGRRTTLSNTITIGNLPDGTFIPARRERRTYALDGTLLTRDSWYYLNFENNAKPGTFGISLGYFFLPPGTDFSQVAKEALPQMPAPDLSLTRPSTSSPPPRTAPSPRPRRIQTNEP